MSRTFFARRAVSQLAILGRDRRGSVTVIMALCLTALTGFLGLGAEVGLWYLEQRDMQNAADAAAIAAATNASSTYDVEAKAVAQQYGFTDGSNNVIVSASNTAPCPSGGTTCYSVTITGSVPLFLSQVVSFTGNAIVNGSAAQTLGATAVAAASRAPRPYCILALGASGAQGIRANGVPHANLAGCDIMSDTTANCNGGNTGADVGDAAGSNNGCGVQQNSNLPKVSDPYSGLASNIPSNPCSSYPQEPTKSKDPPLVTSNQWAGAKSLSGNTIVCGDLQLTGNVAISGSNAVLVIENGQLDTNGYTLQTASGAGLTIVFAGDNGNYTHAPTGGGTLDIAAPTSGAWQGVAIYQAPSLSSGVNVSAAGNTPTWDISGLVYLPHSSVTLSGAVNKASNGQSCFGLVVDNILVNGTGAVLEHGACPLAGLALPTGIGFGRGELVN